MQFFLRRTAYKPSLGQQIHARDPLSVVLKMSSNGPPWGKAKNKVFLLISGKQLQVANHVLQLNENKLNTKQQSRSHFFRPYDKCH